MAFRNNRSTVWSLTQDGTVLNLHSAYRRAPEPLLDAFATLARDGGVASGASRRAAHQIGAWPDVTEAIRLAREERKATGGES